ncbi:hypothetical protein BLTE_08340 [Blastochloris tepida]|uniref:Uncharacterized protein n=1 Tax=Blastochloris tepida TaxID=2233851 RepID=A0A348FXW6_9HYPH|nr:hypothetical protein BLTE_08340 [Blastochloris tepida]
MAALYASSSDQTDTLNLNRIEVCQQHAADPANPTVREWVNQIRGAGNLGQGGRGLGHQKVPPVRKERASYGTVARSRWALRRRLCPLGYTLADGRSYWRFRVRKG